MNEPSCYSYMSRIQCINLCVPVPLLLRSCNIEMGYSYVYGSIASPLL